MMKSISCVFLLACIALTVNGHAYFSSITVDGVEHEEGDCIRPHPNNQYDYPISQVDRPNGLQSNDMTCGWLPAASNPANRKCAVNPGATLVLQWHYEMGLGEDDDFIIDPSHKGPCLVYLAKSETGSGAVWFKIFEDGYNQTTHKWCVDKLRTNKGKLTIKLPTDITPGNYLLRSELIALHEGFELTGAQPYVGCAEITVGGSGTVNPVNKVAFPGAYTKTDPGIFFDIYTGGNPAYPIPGPPVYVSQSSGTASSGNTPPATPPVTTQKATTARSTTARSTTARATTARSTTARATTARATTARASSSTTTGRASSSTSTTTGRAASPPASTPVPTPAPSGSPCILGHQRCAGNNAYQTCGWATNTVTDWAAVQPCPSGLSCHLVQENYVWCY